MTHPQIFARACTVLYGGGWREPIAAALGVSTRNVLRWHRGERDIPPGVWGEIRELLIAHSDEARRLAHELPTAQEQKHGHP